MLNRAASKRNAFWSLLAAGLVLALCWSQQLSAASLCPLNAELYERADVPAVEPLFDLDVALVLTEVEQSDCDLTEQLLNGHAFQADLFLPTCLLLLWLLVCLVARKSGPWRQSEPIVSPRRRHLLFCVFRE